MIERLGEGLQSRLILVSAPAGFGKATIVGGWVAATDLNQRFVCPNDRTKGWACHVDRHFCLAGCPLFEEQTRMREIMQQDVLTGAKALADPESLR